MTAQQSDPYAIPPEYETQFLKILQNHEKLYNERTARTRGFVVIARGATSLAPLQALCLDSVRQTYNQCFTARYRLDPTAALGTLLAAFITDLSRIREGKEALLGDLKPEFSKSDTDSYWREISKLYLNRLTMPVPTGSAQEALTLLSTLLRSQGNILAEQVEKGVANLNESIFQTGQRLVLFGELTDEASSTEEWNAAVETLFEKLPERVGLVLSGAPKDFKLPDDPHFLEIILPKSEGSADLATAVYKYTESSFHRDEPAGKDELNVNDYANAIARFILHPQTQPPLTVGIHGPWGKGKSSFMRLVDSALIKHSPVNRDLKRSELNGETNLQRWNDLVGKLLQAEQKMQSAEASDIDRADYEQTRKLESSLWSTMESEAKQNVISVTFNAWQFEDSKQTWAGLASQVSHTIEMALPWHSRQWLKLNYTWKERKRELILTLLLPLSVILIVAGLVSVGFFSSLTVGKPEGVGLLLPAGSVLLTIWFVSSQLLKIAVPISERVLSYVRMPDYREQMGFQHRVRDDLQFLYRFLVKRRPGCRIVVYIDDLDRCSESKIMEILQAINLILASSQFFVFVGMDTEMIYRAISGYYKEKVPDSFPENYLSKIIQISFYLPELNKARQSYLSTLFSATARQGLQSLASTNGDKATSTTVDPVLPANSLAFDMSSVLTIVPVQLKEAEDTADELQAFQDYSDFLDDNPREIKRLINIHRLIKILLQKQNTSWSSGRQRKLVKWLIFCERWPHLVDDVLELRKSQIYSDYLLPLAARFKELQENRQSTAPVPEFDRLEEFAKFSRSAGGDPVDPLSDRDLDDDFRLAAYLSQLVRKK